MNNYKQTTTTITAMIEMENTMAWAFSLAVFTILYASFLLGIHSLIDMFAGFFILYMGFQVAYNATKYIFHHYVTIYEKEKE